MTEEQKKAASERMKAMHAKKKAEKLTQGYVPKIKPDSPRAIGMADAPEVANEAGTDEILRQLKELQESNALLKAALLNGQQGQTAQIGSQGGLVGEVEKYLVDPANYPDPTKRLSEEPRLQPMAFKLNYELEYEVTTSNYENKGISYKEPKFTVKLNRVVLDDQGMPTNKRYLARGIVFHEDPNAAIVIARENGVDVDKSNEKQFLDEMRYLRVKDWLFDIFWAKPVQESERIREENVGGRLVQVFTKNSEDASRIDFSKITKMV
jgi:hypothetical protein